MFFLKFQSFQNIDFFGQLESLPHGFQNFLSATQTFGGNSLVALLLLNFIYPAPGLVCTHMQ